MQNGLKDLKMTFGTETRQAFLETEIGLLKDTVWRLTGRVFVLENFIKKEFGEVLEASVLYSQSEEPNEGDATGSNNPSSSIQTKRPHSTFNSPNSANKDCFKKRKCVEGELKSPNSTTSLDKIGGVSLDGGRPLRIRTASFHKRNYREDSDEDFGGKGGIDSDWPASDDDCNIILLKDEIVEEIELEFDADGTNGDHFLGNQIDIITDKGNAESNSKTSENSKSGLNASKEEPISSGLNNEHGDIKSVNSTKPSISLAEALKIDEDFRMNLPAYFSKFLGRFKCHDIFPSAVRYEEIKAILQLKKGESLPGVCKTRRLRVHQRFVIEDINGEEALVCRHSGKKVLKHTEFFDAMKLFHDESGHTGRDATHRKIQEIYLCVPRELITSFIRECSICISRRSGNKKKPAGPEGATGAEGKEES